MSKFGMLCTTLGLAFFVDTLASSHYTADIAADSYGTVHISPADASIPDSEPESELDGE